MIAFKTVLDRTKQNKKVGVRTFDERECSGSGKESPPHVLSGTWGALQLSRLASLWDLR